MKLGGAVFFVIQSTQCTRGRAASRVPSTRLSLSARWRRRASPLETGNSADRSMNTCLRSFGSKILWASEELPRLTLRLQTFFWTRSRWLAAQSPTHGAHDLIEKSEEHEAEIVLLQEFSLRSTRPLLPGRDGFGDLGKSTAEILQQFLTGELLFLNGLPGAIHELSKSEYIVPYT